MFWIAAIHETDGGIGREGGLLTSIPEDMAFFRRMTWGKAVVLGRETLATFPGGKPLPGRENWILSTTLPRQEGAVVFPDLGTLLAQAAGRPQDQVAVIGGQQVYRQLLAYCQRGWATWIDGPLPPADRFFPSLEGWMLEEEEAAGRCGPLAWRICRYRNPHPMPLL